ncbi:MAG: hypothetical protein Q8Q18_03370 [bacterium]|nr:hypothetical protein [bacterium]
MEGNTIINNPVLGEDYSFRGHHQSENIQKPFTGFRQGEGSQTIVDFHTHPAYGESLKGDVEEWLLSPSISDISALLYAAKLNRSIAELFGRTYWINPVSVIGSPVSDKWTLIQIDPVAARQVNFESEELWRKAVWKMYEHYHPRQAKRGTGPIAELFGPSRTPLDSMFARFLGNLMQVPKFLMTSNKRYREFVNAGDITWIVIDPSDFPQAINFSYKIEDIKENMPEEDEDDFDDFEAEDD